MPLSVGDKLGPYEILIFAPIGVGGRGEVYRAREPQTTYERPHSSLGCLTAIEFADRAPSPFE
jgi:hypothetical protein